MYHGRRQPRLPTLLPAHDGCVVVASRVLRGAEPLPRVDVAQPVAPAPLPLLATPQPAPCQGDVHSCAPVATVESVSRGVGAAGQSAGEQLVVVPPPRAWTSLCTRRWSQRSGHVYQDGDGKPSRHPRKVRNPTEGWSPSSFTPDLKGTGSQFGAAGQVPFPWTSTLPQNEGRVRRL